MSVDDGASVVEDGTLVIGVLSNDTDVDGDGLAVTNLTQPANGSAGLNEDGTVTYTPDGNFNGVDSFTYTVNDGLADGNVATVSVTVSGVNDPPVGANDTVTTAEDTAVVVDVLANDGDVEGDTLTVTNLTQPASGGVVLNVDGTVTYTPDGNFNGTDSFTYTANDGVSDSNVATVSLTVSAVNDAPVGANDNATATEDLSVTVDVLSNDSDPDGDGLTVTNLTQPEDGTAVLNVDGTVTYTPDANFEGTDTLTYTASDGVVNSGVVTVTVTVEVVNDPPVAAGDTGSTAEDSPLRWMSSPTIPTLTVTTSR